MQKILEKFMKKYWKNAKKTGKVREIRQSKKVGTMTQLLIFLLQYGDMVQYSIVSVQRTWST